MVRMMRCGGVVQDVKLVLEKSLVIALLRGQRFRVKVGIFLDLQLGTQLLKVQDGVLRLERFHQVVPVAIARSLNQLDHLDQLLAIVLRIRLLDAVQQRGDLLVQQFLHVVRSTVVFIVIQLVLLQIRRSVASTLVGMNRRVLHRFRIILPELHHLQHLRNIVLNQRSRRGRNLRHGVLLLLVIVVLLVRLLLTSRTRAVLDDLDALDQDRRFGFIIITAAIAATATLRTVQRHMMPRYLRRLAAIAVRTDDLARIGRFRVGNGITEARPHAHVVLDRDLLASRIADDLTDVLHRAPRVLVWVEDDVVDLMLPIALGESNQHE